MQNIDLFERQVPTGLASPAGRRAVLASVLGLIASALVYLLQNQELRSTRHELERVQALNDHLQRSIAGIPGAELAMSDRLAAAEDEVHAQETVVHTLTTGGLAHTSGFATSLRAFGRTSTEGVWLTAIDLDNRRGSIVVEGRAIDASRIPLMLQNLRTDPYFAGTTFSAIELSAGNADSTVASDRALRFRVSTPTADLAAAPSSHASAESSLLKLQQAVQGKERG
jgi:Tfp pilus assembly protein PilN